MMNYLRKRYYGLYVLIILAAVIFQIYLRLDPVRNLHATFGSVSFQSNNQDHRMKELMYRVGIKNSSSKEVRFHAVMIRPEADWYPYLDSIPEKYYTDLLVIPPEHGELYEIEYTYNSPDDRVTGGSLGDFKVKFISEDEYQKIKKQQ